MRGRQLQASQCRPDVEEIIHSVDFSSLDISILDEKGCAFRSEFISFAYPLLINGLCDRLREHWTDNILPNKHPTWQNGTEQEKLWQKYTTGAAIYRRYTTPKEDIPTFAADRIIGCSTHEVFYGKPYPATISRRAEAFLTAFKDVSVKKKPIISYALDNAYGISLQRKRSVGELLTERVCEALESEGYDPGSNRIVTTDASSTFFRNFTQWSTRQRRIGKTYERPITFGTAVYIFYMAVFIHSMYYGVSVDYLIREDYSEFAVSRDGTPLTKYQKSILSKFLCLSAEQQETLLVELARLLS